MGSGGVWAAVEAVTNAVRPTASMSLLMVRIDLVFAPVWRWVTFVRERGILPRLHVFSRREGSGIISVIPLADPKHLSLLGVSVAMYRKTLLASAFVCLTLAIGCGKNNPSPVSPTGSAAGDQGAAADGSTLKANAPTIQSPTNGVRVQGEIVLKVANAQAKFAEVPLTYRFEVFNQSGKRVYESAQVPQGNGTTSHSVSSSALEFNKPHTWRARAEYFSAHGPWSGTGSFLTPEGGYIRESEILDPLTNGKTVGTAFGNVTFIQGQGAKLEDNLARISYQLPVTLQEGEYSFIAQGVDEGNAGSKVKVMSMGEGGGDVTANDYRMTIEVRGRDYTTAPGTVSFRIITGESANNGRIHDTRRRVVSWTRADTNFFRMWWETGRAGYEIRKGGPTGAMKDSGSVVTDGHPYRPSRHFIHIGAPPSRAGAKNSSHPQMTVKSVWVSGRPRPNFLTEFFTQP